MSPKLRLLLASCLFVGWIGYLAYLVAVTREPVILSRPQFLVADLYVVANLTGGHDAIIDANGKAIEGAKAAKVDGKDVGVDAKGEAIKGASVVKVPDGKVQIVEVVWPAKTEDKVLQGKQDVLIHDLDKCQIGWHGPGNYILPLTRKADRLYLTEIPLSPGFFPDPKTHSQLRIYPETNQATRQLAKLIDEFHSVK